MGGERSRLLEREKSRGGGDTLCERLRTGERPAAGLMLRRGGGLARRGGGLARRGGGLARRTGDLQRANGGGDGNDVEPSGDGRGAWAGSQGMMWVTQVCAGRLLRPTCVCIEGP